MLHSSTVNAVITVVLAAAALVPRLASGQDVPTLLYEEHGADTVLNALYRACYEAGMSVDAGGGDVLVCSASLAGDARLPDGSRVVSVGGGLVWHKIRFALAERSGGVRVWAYPWIEIEDADDVVLEEDIGSAAYLERVQAELERIDAALAAGPARREPWTEHYDSAHEWRLDAHLKAVDHCDRHLDALTGERVARQLEQAGVQPIGTSLRDRCEELYEPVYLWGLARGMAEPTVEAYVAHRRALPREARCTGQLALEAVCR